MRMGMAVFGSNVPTYHIALYDHPTIVWDFHSLMLGVQMMFSFLLTDEQRPMKLCAHCHKVFIAEPDNDTLYCSARCKNKSKKN